MDFKDENFFDIMIKIFRKEMILMTQQEIIKAFMKSLDETKLSGEAALNEAIRACSPFSNFAELKAAMIKDCKNTKSGNDFLKNY